QCVKTLSRWAADWAAEPGCQAATEKEQVAMARHTSVGSATSALIEIALIVSIGPLATTAARPQAVAPEKSQGDARGSLRPKFRLRKVPVIALGPRGPLTKQKADGIRACIARLASIDSADSGPPPTMSGGDFLPVSTKAEGIDLLLMDHQLKGSDALRMLVKIGPDAVPFLLGALNDKTPTNLKLEHRSAIGAMWF